MKRLALGIFAILTLSGCLVMPHYQTLTGKVNGSIVDTQNRPIKGAQVDYLYNSHRLLGTTKTNVGGQFELGPFKQWFYLVYIGSPGVCPFPHTLDAFRLYPDALKVTTENASSVFLIGSQEEFEAEISPSHRKHMTLPRAQRWTGSSPFPKLVLHPGARDAFVPTIKLSTVTLQP